jgi:hypothetical protein
MMCKCEIQWIDDKGKPTPDDNDAIGLCRTIERDELIAGRVVHFPASQWFYICATHYERLVKYPHWKTTS